MAGYSRYIRRNYRVRRCDRRPSSANCCPYGGARRGIRGRGREDSSCNLARWRARGVLVTIVIRAIIPLHFISEFIQSRVSSRANGRTAFNGARSSYRWPIFSLRRRAHAGSRRSWSHLVRRPSVAAFINEKGENARPRRIRHRVPKRPPHCRFERRASELGNGRNHRARRERRVITNHFRAARWDQSRYEFSRACLPRPRSIVITIDAGRQICGR